MKYLARILCCPAVVLALTSWTWLAPALLQADPKDDYRLAQLAEKDGDYRTAIALYEALVGQYPGDPKLRAALAQAKLAAKKSSSKGALEGKLKAVILSQVEFSEADLDSVFLFLTQKTDEATGGKLHPNFIYKGSQEDRMRPQITLRLSNVPVSEVIRYVGELTSTAFVYETHAIVGTPLAMGGRAPEPAGQLAP